MKKTFQCILIGSLLMVGFSLNASAGTFLDDFNDGNADGWWLSAPNYPYYGPGNWRVENQMLTQDLGGDQYKAILNGSPIGSQTVETRLALNGPSGYGGITVWYQNVNNWIDVEVYPAVSFVKVIEVVGGTLYEFRHPHEYNNEPAGTWYNLRVEANGQNGEIAVFLDGTYLFTYIPITTIYSGLSGLNSGNAGGFFDDFKLADYISPLHVDIDIKPGSEENTFNFNDHGVIPVAILGASDFDVTQIDPTTILLQGMKIKMVDKKGKLLCNCIDVNNDGYLDLLVMIEDANGNFTEGQTEAILTGALYDGTEIEGADSIRLSKKSCGSRFYFGRNR